MGFWSGLGKIGGLIGGVAAAPFTGGGSLAALPAILGGAGAAMGAFSQGQAQNRGEKFGGQMDLERLLMDRERNYQDMNINRAEEGRASGNDAWRRALAAQHTLDPGPRPQLSPYSVAPRQANEHERIAAQAMAEEVAGRLLTGNQIAPVTERPLEVDRNLLNAGWLEKALGIGGAGLGAYSAAAGSRLPSSRVAGASRISSGLYSAPRNV